MESIEGLGRDLTIIIVAHRFTTIRRCDLIVELARGRVAAEGTYNQLFANRTSFREMAKLVEERNN